MKKVILALVLVAVFLSAGIAEQIFIEKTFQKIEASAEQIRETVEKKDFESAHTASVELMDYWENKKHLTEALISHNETKDLTLRFAELEGYIAADDDKSATATAAIIADQCKNLRHILGFCWDTVL